MQRCGLLSLLVCGLLPQAATATHLADWDLWDLVRRADLILVGQVQAQDSVRVNGRLMTESRIAVDEVLLGSAGPHVILSQLGGRDGNIVNEIVGDAQLETGSRVLLFTYAHADGRRYLVGMGLGAYLVQGEELSQQIDVPLLGGDGRLRPPPGRRSVRLTQVRAAVRKLLR